jgi:hypothetical protein
MGCEPISLTVPESEGPREAALGGPCHQLGLVQAWLGLFIRLLVFGFLCEIFFTCFFLT